MEAESVCEAVGEAEVLVLGSPLGKGVVALVDSVVSDVVEVWLSPAERLVPSWLSVRFPGVFVLFVGARVVTVGLPTSVRKP